VDVVLGSVVTATLGDWRDKTRSQLMLQRRAKLMRRTPRSDGEIREHPFSISEGHDGIVRLIWKKNLRITGGMAKQAMLAVDDLNGERSRPLLVYMARTNALDREAREHFAEKCSISAIALVGETPVDRLLATFTLGHGGARAPTKYFTEENDAIAWLLQATSLPPS
jgi:hypothetical protein